MQEGFEARDPDDQCSQMSKESTDQNPPHDSDLDEDELLGTVTDLSVPGDIWMTPLPSSFPQGRMTCNHLKREELA